MFRPLILFALVAAAAAIAVPPHFHEPLLSYPHQFSLPRFTEDIPFSPCDAHHVEKVVSPCVDKVITTVDRPVVEKIVTHAPVIKKIVTHTPVVEKIITQAPVVEKIITHEPVVEKIFTPDPLYNTVIAPVNVPTAINHIYTKEVINKPVASSYPATVPVASETVYNTPYYPYAHCSAPFPALSAFPGYHHIPQHAHHGHHGHHEHHGHHGVHCHV